MTMEIILGAPFFDQQEAGERFNILLEFPESLYSNFGRTNIFVSPYYHFETKYYRALAKEVTGTVLADGIGETKEEAVQIMIGKLTVRLREQSMIEQAIKECYESFSLPEGSNPRASVLNLLASKQ